MSWTDKGALKVIWYLRDKYKVKQFIETGTYKGVNLLAHRGKFEELVSCEKVREYFNIACKRTNYYNSNNSIFIWNVESPIFLKEWRQHEMFNGTPIIYLDAHFYNKTLPKRKRFVVLDELKALRGFSNCIIIIHDFDNNLGHITYDGVSLDMDLLTLELFLVNPGFHFYTNTLESCDIVKTKKDITNLGLTWDKEMQDTLKFIHSKPCKTYRGILYCLPSKLSKKEMTTLGLREWI